MHTEKDSIAIMPLDTILGPLAVVPLVDTSDYRYAQTKDQWLAVTPYRMWGDHFGRTIEWEGNDWLRGKLTSSSDDDEDEDDQIEVQVEC